MVELMGHLSVGCHLACLFAQLAVVKHMHVPALWLKSFRVLCYFLLTKEKATWSFDKRDPCPLTKGTSGAMPTKKGGLNSKGRPAGSGCVSSKRREEFKKKGMERELKNMKLEDEFASKVDWEEDKRLGNKKVRKLTAGDIAEMLKPKPKDENKGKEVVKNEAVVNKKETAVEEVQKKEEEQVKVEEKKVGECKPDPPLDKKGGEGSLDKRDVPPASVAPKKELGPSTKQMKEDEKKRKKRSQTNCLEFL